MGKFRSKLKGQTKGKRWPKGQSSSSNPETKKYRNLAKSRFFQENLGPSNLTSDALRKHDTISSFVPVQLPTTEPSDTMSDASTYKTIETFASDWSECSNISFNRLLTGFKPDSALHKEMLAILAAVTEVIKQNGGEETSTEYFAALMTTAEVTEPEMSLAAVLGLLGMVVRTVPRAVLRAQFAPSAKLFLGLLERNSEGENSFILKELLNLLAQLLRAQEPAAWQETNTLQMLSTLLAFICHTKPRVRRGAQKSVAAVLQASCFMLDEHPPAHHPAASHVANFCISQLEVNGAVGQSTTLHTLALLGTVVAELPAAPLRRVVEHVLALLAGPGAGGDILVISCALRVLHALCSATRQFIALPATHAARLVTALLDLQPAGATEAWLTTLAATMKYLANLDKSSAVACLPRAVTALSALWLSERSPVMTATTHALHTLLEDCVEPSAADHLDRVYSILRGCFGYQYHKVWHLVLHVHATAFRCAPRDLAPRLVGPTLYHLAELRDSYNFTYNNELEFAVGAAVQALGPELVLSVISLKKEDGSVNLDRSWMLPVLKEHVQGSTLEYFAREILPLALACERQASVLLQNNESIAAHSFTLLGVQCWSLLPSFCRQPTDVCKSFRHLAKILGSAITDRKDLRLFVLSSLRKLIQCSSSEDKAELARFAKNYLPILFNLYTIKPVGTDGEGQRLAALDTVKEYLQIAPEDLIKQLFDNAVVSLRGSEDAFTREGLLDLVRCLAVHQPTSALGPLYADFIQPVVGAANVPKKEQKKAYRLLEEICKSDAVGCQEFIRSQRKQIAGLVTRGLGAAAPCSRAARLRVQGALLKATPQLHHDSRLLRSILPEAVMCLVEPSARARSAAQSVLLTAAEALEARDQLPQLVELILAGLGGPSHLVRATITALALLTQHHASALALGQLVETIGKLTMSDTRDIVCACLLYFKIYITVVPTPLVAQNLPDIMKAITSMTSDCSNHFRLRVRDILDKLLRKFGSNSITSYVTDATMLKRVRNLRKMQERKKRRKIQETDGGEANEEEFAVRATSNTMQDILADSDEDASDEDELKQTKKKQNKTWIQEDADDILDLMEPSSAGRITSKRPGAANLSVKNQKVERGFKTSSDGRIIIQDLGSDSDSDDTQSDASEEEGEAETVKLGPTPAPGKRKRTDTESVASSAPPAMKYKAGGSGIHRPLDPYTYLPLQRSQLNKRRQRRPGGAAPSFKQLLSKNKRGLKKTRKS